MDLDPLTIIITFAIGSEVCAFVLRKLLEPQTKQRIKDVVLGFARGFSLLFVLGALVALMWGSTQYVHTALARTSGHTFFQVVIAFAYLFVLAALFVHAFCYCFSGLLHRVGGRLWPKGIDYIYYVFGALALILIAANIFEEKALVADAIRGEILGGIYLFNLKIFKTSYDLFPALQSSGHWVRDPFFGKLL